MRKSRENATFGLVTIFAGLSAAIALVAAFAVVYLGRPLPTQIDPEITAQYGPLSVMYVDYNSEAELHVTRKAGPGVQLGGQNGVVTGVEVRVADSVDHGQLLFWLNQEPVLALQTETVFFRDMTEGMTGADVSALQEYLVQFRNEVITVDGKFGAPTTRAVKRWQQELGVAQTGQVPANRFAVIEEPFTVATVKIAPWEELSAQDESPVQGAQTYEISNITSARGILAPGSYLFVSVGGELPVTFTTTWQAEVEQDLAALVPAEALTEETITVSGRLKLADPEQAFVLPASALLSVGGSATCIWVKDGTSPVTDFQVVGSTVSGSVMVQSPSLTADQEVLVNPAEFYSSCP